MKICDIFQFEKGLRERKFLELLKACILYREFFNEFELKFTKELILKYKNSELNMHLSSTDLRMINEIANKLKCDIDFSYKEICHVIAVEKSDIS